MGPARSRNLGSRGKIHERWRHGLIASSASQRPIVDADASQIACSMTKRCSSDRLKRDSGTPWVLGSSQAIALTCAISCGVKAPRATRPRLILQTVKTLFAKSSPPLPDDLRAHLKPRGDLDVGQALGGVEHDLRALHVTVGERQLGGAPLKLAALFLGERDLNRRRHRHQDSPAALRL